MKETSPKMSGEMAKMGYAQGRLPKGPKASMPKVRMPKTEMRSSKKRSY